MLELSLVGYGARRPLTPERNPVARDPRCSICTNPPLLDAVDGALLVDTPAETFRRYSGQLSKSALYRHSANHREDVKIAPSFLPDGVTETGDVVADLAALRRSLIQQREAALSRSQFTVANSTALRIESVSVALLREAGVTGERAAQDAKTFALLQHGISRATHARPDFAREYAAAIRIHSSDDFARELAEELEKGAAVVESRESEAVNG